MKRVLVAAFSEVPSLSFESEAITEIAKAFDGWCEVDVVAPMLEPSAHLEAFFGGRLHRVSVAGAEDVAAAAATFERALERHVNSTPYDALHLMSPVGARTLLGRAAGTVPVVVEMQSVPSLAARFGKPEEAWLDRLVQDETAALGAAAALILHEASDASAIRYRRKLAPNVVVPEPVDLDAWCWEQLVPGERPVVLVLDPGLQPPARFDLLRALGALERGSGAALWRLVLPSARIQPSIAEPETPLAIWASGGSEAPVRLRIAALAALNTADVVVVPHLAGLDECGATVSSRRWGILQAAACRRPLVVSDSARFPVPSDMLENVFRFAPGDWDAATQLVRSVLLHPAKAMQVSERASKRVEAAHSAADFRRRIRAVYAGLLGHDPERPGPMPVHPNAPGPSDPEAA